VVHAPEFTAANSSAVSRTETLRASVPFPVGTQSVAGLANLVVTGESTAWLPLQLWGDGSVKVAQAQFTDTLAAGQTKTYTLSAGTALSAAFSRHAWTTERAGALELGAEARDTFDDVYRAVIDSLDVGEVVQTSPLIRVTRHRVYHNPVVEGDGLARDFLTSTFYVTEFKDQPVVIVDWILGNDYLGSDAPAGSPDQNLYPLGHIDVNDAYFLFKGASVVRPYRAVKEVIGGAVPRANDFTGHQVLDDDWIGDGQTKRYRFFVGQWSATGDPGEIAAWLATLTAMEQYPVFPLATQQTWEESKAAGLMGGPITGPANAATLAAAEYATWEGTEHFSTWGGRGDDKDTNTTGTPRNGPLSEALAHAIQANYHPLLVKLEQMAWIQAARAYHLYDLELTDNNTVVLWEGMPYLPAIGDTLGRRAIYDSDPYLAYRTRVTVFVGDPPVLQPVGGDPHDWQGFDHEHYTSDLLFDYWTVTGDAWAKEELRQLGQSMKGLMKDEAVGAFTSAMQAARAEGWCIQGMVQSSQATQDAGLKTFYMQRVTEILDVENHHGEPGEALAWQANHPGPQWPYDNEFFMPWQHGAVLWGFLGAYIHWGDAILLEIAEHVAATVDYSWVSNVVGHPVFGNVAEGLRYYVPATANGVPVAANYFDSLPAGIKFGDSPLGGAHTFLTGGLLHLAALTANPAIEADALYYGGLLLGDPETFDRWNRWNYCQPLTEASEPGTAGAAITLAPVTMTAAATRGRHGVLSVTLGSLVVPASEGVQGNNFGFFRAVVGRRNRMRQAIRAKRRRARENR
jgi:hypothetical protein